MVQSLSAPCCSKTALIDAVALAHPAQQLAALGDVTRLQLVLFIYQSSPAPVCACAFPEAFAAARSTISHHLTKLVQSEVLLRQQHGKWAYYTIHPEFDTRILDVISVSRAVSVQTSNEIGTNMEDRSELAHSVPETEIATGAGTVRILFACTRNAGRSQIAAALARSLAPSNVLVQSAGSAPVDEVHPVVEQALAEIGLRPLSNPEKLDPAKVKAADWVVTMGCGEQCPIFPGKHYEDWDVADPGEQPIERVREIVADIRLRVEDLLARLT